MDRALSIPFFEVTDGLGYYIGENIQTKFHSHNAVEIVLALDESFTIQTNEREIPAARFSVIAANVLHSFLGENGIYLFIYLDPQLSFAKELSAQLYAGKQEVLCIDSFGVSETRKKLKNLLQHGATETATLREIVQELLIGLCPRISEENKSDLRFLKATAHIKSSLHLDMSLQKVAEQVFLSPSRFAHLFRQHAGVPFRRYVLWCRIQASLKAVMVGQSLTQAAYEGGFSDSAHLSRTFMEMFGVSPSGGAQIIASLFKLFGSYLNSFAEN